MSTDDLPAFPVSNAVQWYLQVLLLMSVCAHMGQVMFGNVFWGGFLGGWGHPSEECYTPKKAHLEPSEKAYCVAPDEDIYFYL